MSWIPYLLLLVVVIAVINKSNKKNPQSTKIATAEVAADVLAEAVSFPYKKLDCLFTDAELSFLGVFNQALTGKVEIFGKVRVADVLGVVEVLSPSAKQTAFNKISAKYFDFVLCDKKTLGILCVIELDDQSHNAKKRQKRD
jgi:hypothetical protein